MSAINTFLLGNGETIARNPCVSPDFCLDWERVRGKLARGLNDGFVLYPKSEFETAAGTWALVEDKDTGDCAWNLRSPSVGPDALDQGIESKSDGFFFPATWGNLLKVKNLVQEHDNGSTIFPSAGAKLGRSTLGIGARFTTLHWPAVEWAMSALGIGLTANQNSIPRELVYDVDAMLEHRLDKVPFPFIGANVPEGHQGQSVEGMSHGCVLSKLKTGFHRRRIAWSFNADHQPIGGTYDEREDALVRGCLLASYITFDLSPELSAKRPAQAADVDRAIESKVRSRVQGVGIKLADGPFEELLRSVWPAMQKMQRRDSKYQAARNAAFTTSQGRAYLRELSIDELPGLTMPETTAVMLALCETLGMPVNFIAPAFGFQKNLPYPDDVKLGDLIARQLDIAERFGVSIGFHSGSGKSAKNYAVMGEVTGGCLEIKTSGRYTYEMGVALANSPDSGDAQLWAEWHDFTADLAAAGAFSSDETEKKMARLFITQSLETGGRPTNVFSSQYACRSALGSLPRSPDHVFFFEYNFLYVLAGSGKAEKSALGDHSAAGYRQRARFYSISPTAKLLYAKRVAAYIIFLARWTGLCAGERCDAAEKLLAGIESYERLIDTISK